MPYQYDVKRMHDLLELLIRKLIPEKNADWLKQQFLRWEQEKKIAQFNFTFTAIPRFIEKRTVHTDEKEIVALQHIRKNFSIHGWSADRLVRCWWLLHLPVESEEEYSMQLENLFQMAEMNEQVALYSTLPLFAWPERFRLRTSEGIRTNIRPVFEAIALNNPYPSEYLEDIAWNQMVLKAFFMNINVNKIIGLDERANQELAYILLDYAHERWAASRAVNPLLWRPLGKFIDEKIFPDIRKLFHSGDEKERKAAALACTQTAYEPARKLLDRYPELKKQAESGEWTWELLEKE